MVNIRYSELPAGLHVRVESDGRRTLIYLLPGLTSDQRKAALLRVRSSARMGQGPELPALAMTRAIAADRITTTVRNSLAATRRHPMLVLPPLVLLVSGAIVLVMLSFVRLTIPVDNQTPNNVPGMRIGSGAGHHSSPPSRPASARPSGRGSHGPASRAGGNHGVGWAVNPSPSPAAAPSSFQPPPPSPGPSPSASASASPSPSPSGDCLSLGPLGLCVSV